MEIPVYIDGRREGTLTMERRGAFTVMEARLRDVGGVVRLWLFGEREACLGVPEPENGELVLIRRFSPSEMRRFPQKPEYAADRRLNGTKPPEMEPPPKTPEPGQSPRHVLWQGGKPYFF